MDIRLAQDASIVLLPGFKQGLVELQEGPIMDL